MTDHQFASFVCGGCGKVVTVPVYCGDRFCPICSRIQKLRVRNRLGWLLEKAEYPLGFNLSFLTLTIQNQSELKPMIKHLLKSFRRLRSRAFWREKVDGGAFVIEITGHPGNWHAHIHALLVARYFPHPQLLKLWRICAKVPAGAYIKRLPRETNGNYMTKYLTKPSEFDSNNLARNDGLKGTRLFAAFGSWYALNRQYVKPVYTCKNCGCVDCLDWTGNEFHDLDENLNPVDVEPDRILKNFLVHRLKWVPQSG